MHLRRRNVLLAVALPLTAAAVRTAAARIYQPSLHPASGTNARAYEVRRVQAHFDSVLRELDAATPALLTDMQAARRTQLITTLRRYRDRAAFPRNYDFDAATPYFVDRRTGTLCAVAYLLASTSRADMVDRIARTNNNVRAADLGSDSAFVSWLDASGLTVAEAARIQPSYGRDSDGPGAIVYVAAGATIATVGTSVGLTAWNVLGNADGHSRKGSIFGLVTGLGTAAIGGTIAYQGTTHDEKQAGRAGVAIGAVGVAAAANSLWNRRTRARADQGSEQSSSGDATRDRHIGIEASVSPVLPLSRTAGTGLFVSVRF